MGMRYCRCARGSECEVEKGQQRKGSNTHRKQAEKCKQQAEKGNQYAWKGSKEREAENEMWRRTGREMEAICNSKKAEKGKQYAE